MLEPVTPKPQSANVFISYRRDDSAGHAGRLFDRIGGHFGDRIRLFMDIDSIGHGEDFNTVIEAALGSCGVFLAVIGKQWLTITDDGGKRRLDDLDDLVRKEIAAALSRNVRVIPVLVQGAAMPRKEYLPEALSDLGGKNPIELSDVRWRYDVDRLIATIEAVLGQTPARRARVSWLRIISYLLLSGIIGTLLLWQVNPFRKDAGTVVKPGISSYHPKADSPSWLKIAWAEQGKGDENSDSVQSRLAEYSKSFPTPPSTTPHRDWSPDFVNWALKNEGYQGVTSDDKSAWLKYGVHLSEPREGCIVVLRRPDEEAPFHVGFYLDTTGDTVSVLGGNVDSKVGISKVPRHWIASATIPRIVAIMDNRLLLYDTTSGGSRSGRTNHNDIQDALVDLAIKFVPIHTTTNDVDNKKGFELLSQAKPDLIVVHVSAFSAETDPDDRGRRFSAFLSNVMTELPNTKLLVYSRAFGRIRQSDVERFALAVRNLKERTFFLKVEPGRSHRYFGDEQVRAKLRNKVEELLGLPVS